MLYQQLWRTALWLATAWSKPLTPPMKAEEKPKVSGTAQVYTDGLGTGTLGGLAVGGATSFASSCFSG